MGEMQSKMLEEFLDKYPKFRRFKDTVERYTLILDGTTWSFDCQDSTRDRYSPKLIIGLSANVDCFKFTSYAEVSRWHVIDTPDFEREVYRVVVRLVSDLARQFILYDGQELDDV